LSCGFPFGAVSNDEVPEVGAIPFESGLDYDMELRECRGCGDGEGSYDLFFGFLEVEGIKGDFEDVVLGLD
jgi:hypothetical protein